MTNRATNRRLKRAGRTSNGALMYPCTVMFEVEQYVTIDRMEIPGVRKSFGAKVRYLLDAGLRARALRLLAEAEDAVEGRLAAAKKLKEKS